MKHFRRLQQKIESRRGKGVDQGREGSCSPASASASTSTDQLPTPPPVPTLTGPAKLPSNKRAGLSAPQSPNRLSTVTVTPSTSESRDLWKPAYDKFRKENPELLGDYDKHVLGDTAVDTGLSSRESIETALNKLLEDREKKQWKVSILGHDIRMRAQVGRLISILKWSDPLVKGAVSTQPYAALAWSGVSLLLPLLTSSTMQNEAMLEGFNSIGELQKYWEAHEKTSLQSEHQQHYQSLIKPLVEVYSLFFAYQAHVICHLSKKQPSRAWKDLSRPKFWTDKLDDINKLSENCCRLMGVTRESEIQENRDSLLHEMEKLRRIQEDMGESYKRHERDDKETRLLQDLATAAGDYDRYKNVNPVRVPGTCEWFLMDERFSNWRDNASSSLLWVSAAPGRGKSVLSKSLIDEGQLAITTITITPSSNELATSRQSTVCYFFFKDGVESHMSSADALCALLHQLFTCPSTSGLIKYALEKHRNYGKSLTEKASELWQILLACVAAPDTGEIICVLDALDECKDESRHELFKILKEFYSQSARLSTENSRLKFLVTSRPYDNLERSFKEFPDAVYLRFDGDDKSEEIRKEIDLVIDARVPGITTGFDAKDQQKISEHLKSMEHRTYLWLHLTLDIIEQSPSEYGRRPDIENLLSTLPTQVSDAYEKILSRSKNQSRTVILLQIVLAATRPLTLDEANVALIVAIGKQEPESHTQMMSERWPTKNFRSIVTNLCGLFISVYDSKLSFIHQTAREFLINPEQEGNWKGSFNMAQSHSTISRSCLLYLLLPDIDEPIEDDSPTQYPYLAYAADSWPLHFVSQEAAGANAFRKHARALCNTRQQAHTWAPSYFSTRDESDIDWSDLALASYLGLSEVVEDILFKEKPDINWKESIYRQTPLSWAAWNGHEGVVKLLLATGQADINSKNRYNQTPLFYASNNGHEGVVKLLLATEQANINSKDRYGKTPLLWATGKGHEGVVKLLLATGQADINSKDKYGQTPLSLAAEKGHEGIVKLLLATGQADINSKDNYGQTPLSLAAEKGHEGVVKLLFATGQADINSKNNYDRTPLSLAAKNGHEGVVKLLLATGQANINSKDSNDQTPLSLAVEEGHEGVVKLLLATGQADSNSEDTVLGQTLLLLAAEKGHEGVVKLLLAVTRST